jgi:hypothetical protein
MMMMMMMMKNSLLLLLLTVFSMSSRQVVGADIADTAAAAAAAEEEKEEQDQLADRALQTASGASIESSYISYDMPPFALSFRTPYNLLSSQEKADDAVLASRLSATLIDVVAEFLLESFRQEIAVLDNDSDSAAVPEMVRQLVKMAFAVEMEYRKTIVEGQDDEQRKRNLRRSLTSTTSSFSQTSSTTSSSQKEEWLELYIEFDGESYFIAPTASSSSSNTPPSPEFMSDLLGGWIEKYMRSDYSVLQQDLTASNEPLLQHMESFLIYTSIDDVDSGKGKALGGFGPLNGVAASANATMNTPLDTILTILVVLVSMATVGAAYFLVRPYWQSRRKQQFLLQQQLGAFPTNNNNNNNINTPTAPCSSLPGRGHDYDHDDNQQHHHNSGGSPNSVQDPGIFSSSPSSSSSKKIAVAESDRWLEENRPDLLAAIQRSSRHNNASPSAGHPDVTFSSSTREDDPDTIMKVSNNNGSPRSNPLQYLYGGMFNKQGSPLASQDGHEGEEAYNHQNQANNTPSSPTWWSKLASSLQESGRGSRGRGTLPCDEDPRRYPFPYQDFPRTDGTPCLIYEEDAAGGSQRGAVTLRRRSQMSSAATTDDAAAATDKKRTDLLSNDDFKRQLSMHSLQGSLDDHDESSSMQQRDHDESIEVPGDYLDCDDNDDGGGGDYDGGKFTSKLERLVAMRHRHYEQEMILQKARDKKQERQKAEAREREMKLRRHEMELNVEAIEAGLTPRALQRNAAATAVAGNVTANNHAASSSSHYGQSASGVAPPTIASYINNTNPNYPEDEGGNNGEPRGQRKLHRSSLSNPDLTYTPTVISDLTASTQETWSGGTSEAIAAAAGGGGGGGSSNGSVKSVPGRSSRDGPSLRHEDALSTSKPPGAPRQNPLRAPPSPRPHASSSSSVSSSSSQLKQLIEQAPAAGNKANRRLQRCFSHRRSFSHGTQNGPDAISSSEEKKVDDSNNSSTSNGNSHQRSGSNAEDVLIFGIAAHTNFV